MSRRKLAVCVSTSKPSSALAAGGGGGSIVMLCPHSGAILSSLRASGDNASKSLLGVSSMSLFPERFTTLGPPLMMAYGGTSTKRDDTYGILLSLRRDASSSSPLIQWKCRLPEAQLRGGLLVSPCGNYVVGGGASGTCFVWRSLGRGTLCRAVKAHYRSITAMAWSDCGGLLVTGGADGIIHVFSLLDLVERSDENEKTVAPIRTWSVHHLPVTCLLAMPSGRMIATSEDGQIVMLELFSEKIVCTIQMPHAIRALAHCSGRRLFAGSVKGSIYMIDLDLYAVHQTAQMGVTVKHITRIGSHEDQVFSADRSEAYKTELIGHEKPISSLAVFSEDDSDWLVSGDDEGEVRIWDLQSRSCVHVIRPWANSVAAASRTTSKTAKSPGKQTLHPVTSIMVLPREQAVDKPDAAFADHSKAGKAKTGIPGLVPPLQKYVDRPVYATAEEHSWIPVPFLQPKRRRVETVGQGASLVANHWLQVRIKRPRIDISDMAMEDGDDVDCEADVAVRSDEVVRLRRELEEAKSTIKRWEQVNSTLMSKLKRSQS